MTPTVELLGPHHNLNQFDSGAPELDLWLAGSARQSHDRDTARVLVIADVDGAVLAYSALVVGTVSRRSLSSRAASGLPQEVPAVLLGKLAVTRIGRSAGLGSALLGHAARQAP